MKKILFGLLGFYLSANNLFAQGIGTLGSQTSSPITDANSNFYYNYSQIVDDYNSNSTNVGGNLKKADIKKIGDGLFEQLTSENGNILDYIKNLDKNLQPVGNYFKKQLFEAFDLSKDSELLRYAAIIQNVADQVKSEIDELNKSLLKNNKISNESALLVIFNTLKEVGTKVNVEKDGSISDKNTLIINHAIKKAVCTQLVNNRFKYLNKENALNTVDNTLIDNSSTSLKDLVKKLRELNKIGKKQS